MKDQKTINNFVDLKDALAQVRANNPQAETRYEKQAKHMGYTKDTNVKPEVISEVKKKKYDGIDIYPEEYKPGIFEKFLI